MSQNHKELAFSEISHLLRRPLKAAREEKNILIIDLHPFVTFWHYKLQLHRAVIVSPLDTVQ